MRDTIQQVLTMGTLGGDLRSEAVEWGAEDPRGAHPTKPVGLCGAMWTHPGEYNTCPRRPPNEPYTYPDPLRAMADGWKLLAPPTQETCTNQDGETWTEWEWWFVREVPRVV